MPTYARCPECHAALPPGAPWCSLCHADLRPPSTRIVAPAQPAPPGPSSELVAAGSVSSSGRHAAPDHDEAPAAPPPVGGRHRRPEADDADPAACAERTDPVVAHHRAGDPDRLRADVDALVADAPLGADGKPDVEALTAQLMARLATSEGRQRASRVPNLDSVPGGKWGVMVGGMVAMAVVLVIVFGILGALVLR